LVSSCLWNLSQVFRCCNVWRHFVLAWVHIIVDNFHVLTLGAICDQFSLCIAWGFETSSLLLGHFFHSISWSITECWVTEIDKLGSSNNEVQNLMWLTKNLFVVVTG
jgi:hypothetical protein